MKNRNRYPKDWPQMAQECKEQANWRCQHCATPHRTEKIGKRSGKPYKVALAASHLDHDPENPAPRLAALCPECHGRYDWSWRVRQADIRLERMKHHMALKQRQGRQPYTD